MMGQLNPVEALSFRYSVESLLQSNGRYALLEQSERSEDLR